MLSRAEEDRTDADRGISIHAIYPGAGLEGFSRRGLIAHIKLHAAKFGLEQYLSAFLELAGRASLAGLETSQLRALVVWLNESVDRLQACCDHPDTPPAH